ncbi:hypothetical protein PSEUBRA_001236 [Kalmanozyma brasiliensis GHG001]|uniref:Uncharacterized protein n=1 Tax=Kalmanozyma brasiliensis (strain GHG001) TaxID=1365824 RepID=V5F0X9_KALBG|nr:uncharacterized protein PSEUBRA_001236 [Kalmanozyma brasiliensis GHG001]EST08919.1 hypothetical protein PSEUBRA_001236 [Kalmanozyma brasiliensis GHG001]
MAGHAIFRARSLANNLLSDEIMSLIHRAAKETFTFPDEHVLASDELVWAARRVAAAYMDCHRYVCIHLAIYAAFAFAMWIPFVLYGVPNLVNLVNHACFHHPKPIPPSHQGFVGPGQAT